MLDVAWGMLFSIPDQDLALQRLAALGVSQLRLWSSLPLNPATAKVLWGDSLATVYQTCSSSWVLVGEIRWEIEIKGDLLVDAEQPQSFWGPSGRFPVELHSLSLFPSILEAKPPGGPSKYKYESLPPKWDAFEGAYTWWFKNPKE